MRRSYNIKCTLSAGRRTNIPIRKSSVLRIINVVRGGQHDFVACKTGPLLKLVCKVRLFALLAFDIGQDFFLCSSLTLCCDGT